MTYKKTGVYILGVIGLVVFLLFWTFLGVRLWENNQGIYHLKPGEEIKLKVKAEKQESEYKSILYLESKESSGQLELSGRDDWITVNGRIFYDVKNQTLQQLKKRSNNSYDWEKIKNRSYAGINLSKTGIRLSPKMQQKFDVTENNTYSIVIKNVSNRNLDFKAKVKTNY